MVAERDKELCLKFVCGKNSVLVECIKYAML